MHFAPSDEQRAMQAAVREVLHRGCAPATMRAVWSGDAQAWTRVWESVVAAGLCTALIGEERGGLGLDDVDAALLFEEAGAVALPGPALESGAAAALLAEAAEHGEVAASWLSRVVNDGAALALYGGPAEFAVEVDRCAAAVRLDGDAVRVAATTDLNVRELGSLDAGRRLFSVEWPSAAGEVVLSGDDAVAACARAVDRAATLCAAQAVGAAATMLAMSVAYAGQREQFGRPIGSFQAVKHRLAQAHVLVEVARPVVHRAAWAVAHDEPDRALRVSMARLHSARAARSAAEAALLTHGAIGYTWDCDLHIWLKRATALAAAWGGEEFHLLRVRDGLRRHGIPGIVAQPHATAEVVTAG
jgi:alkylation response protein AidB-like acyl-CoA dehydrogenase